MDHHSALSPIISPYHTNIRFINTRLQTFSIIQTLIQPMQREGANAKNRGCFLGMRDLKVVLRALRIRENLRDVWFSKIFGSIFKISYEKKVAFLESS